MSTFCPLFRASSGRNETPRRSSGSSHFLDREQSRIEGAGIGAVSRFHSPRVTTELPTKHCWSEELEA
jgi:hypothetical protein